MLLLLDCLQELGKGAEDGPVRGEEVLEQGELGGGPGQQLLLQLHQGGAVRLQGVVQPLAQGGQVHGGVGPVPVPGNVLADIPA